MSDPAVAQAHRLVAAGQVGAAVAALIAAGKVGDVDALMQHAVWCLAGDPVPRDLPRARALLARAVAIGHVDAALMEVALAANGSGGPVDWASALRLLEVAARGDPVAAEQLALVRAMALSADGTPLRPAAAEPLAADGAVAGFPSLLTPAECRHIAGMTQGILEPAQVIDPVSGRRVAHPIRTAWEAVIGPTREDLVARAINLRLAAISATDVAQGESLTVLRYAPGQQFRPHLDTIAGVANQRVATVLIYLNEGFAGGETVFPELGLTVRPRAGDAVLFRSVDAEGGIDERMRHAGLPVISGAKWLATRWIRAKPIDPWAFARDAA